MAAEMLLARLLQCEVQDKTRITAIPRRGKAPQRLPHGLVLPGSYSGHCAPSCWPCSRGQHARQSRWLAAEVRSGQAICGSSAPDRLLRCLWLVVRPAAGCHATCVGAAELGAGLEVQACEAWARHRVWTAPAIMTPCARCRWMQTFCDTQSRMCRRPAVRAGDHKRPAVRIRRWMASRGCRRFLTATIMSVPLFRNAMQRHVQLGGTRFRFCTFQKLERV